MKIGKLKCTITKDVCVAYGDVMQGDVLFSYDKNEWFTLYEIIMDDSEALTIIKYRGISVHDKNFRHNASYKGAAIKNRNIF